MKTINILNDKREQSGWVQFTVKGRIMSGEAKVYNEGDGFGVDYNGYGVKEGSRVSKLYIRSRKATTMSSMVYNWDRGFDYHDTNALPQELLDAIVEDLDSLPRL